VLRSPLHDPSTTSGSDIRTAKKTVLECFLGARSYGVGGLEGIACTVKRSFVSGGGLCWWYKKVNTVVNAAVFFWQKNHI
jgi:hypothetical protein